MRVSIDDFQWLLCQMHDSNCQRYGVVLGGCSCYIIMIGDRWWLYMMMIIYDD